MNTNNSKVNKKLKLNVVNERFLSSMLRVLCTSGTLPKKFLINIESFMNKINIAYYEKDQTVSALIQAIKIVERRRQEIPESFNLDSAIGELDTILNEDYAKIKDDIIIPVMTRGFEDKNPTEYKWINECIETTLQFYIISEHANKLSNYAVKLNMSQPGQLKKTIEEFRKVNQEISDEFVRTDSVSENNIINTNEETYIDVLMETFDEVKNPKYALKTGLKTFNTFLSEEGGFKNSCFYIFYASINSFKSALLQYIAEWIKKYNWNNFKKKYEEDGRIPTVLFYSFENGKTENAQRAFYMNTGKQLKDFADKKEAVKFWIDVNKNVDTKINISYVYAEAGTVRISDMRKQIHALNDSGYRVIAVVADYLELIRPEDEDLQLENRLKLGYISTDFHVMCVSEDIVGITAMQMNRAAEAVKNELKQKNQTNIMDQIGNSAYIGESYSIEKPADFSAYIGTERSPYDNKLYLTIKRGKCRYRRTDVQYFVQELENGFYIHDDLNTDKVTSKTAIENTQEKTLTEEVVKISEAKSKAIAAEKKKKEEIKVSNAIEEVLGL